MNISEKIELLLKEKSISKREFVTNLLALEPRLKLTGEIPTEQTIYRYLNGKREIKVELIPYIAEVLGVSEQELFSFDIEYACEYNHRHSKEVREIIHLLQHAPKGAIENIRNYLLKYQTLNDSLL
jgi:transcriptional regulator with XRE-family HTH domain